MATQAQRQLSSSADGGAGAPAAPASNDVGAEAAPNGGVRPPDRWGDDHMNWRHNLSFVFFMNGPLAFWHPHADSRNVCDFLKKSPRSGPQDDVRSVSRSDNRRTQRRGDREEERSQSASRQDDIIQSLRDSRDATARAAQEANHLTRLQLQFQIAQHASANSTAHLVAAQTALSIVNSCALDENQAKKKKKLEKSLAKACLEVSVAAAPNPFASLLAELSNPSFRCVRACNCFLFTAHAHICRMVPILPSVRADAPTVSRRGNGGAPRPHSDSSQMNLNPILGDAAAANAQDE
jgi:hypothetical protein